MESSTSINDLPEEILLTIAQFLRAEDINVCINVCKLWRFIFNNSNKIWRRFCFYREKHFKTVPELCSQLAVTQNVKSVDSCIWRKCFDHQQRLWDNWSKGKYAVENTNVDVPDLLVEYLVYIDECEKGCEYIDDHGNHWIFLDPFKNDVMFLNITKTSNIYHNCINDIGPCDISIVRDKVYVDTSVDVRVFEFKYPEYKMNLLYTIVFHQDDIPQNDENSHINIPIQSRYFLIGNFLVTYDEEFPDIHSANIHIWDLEIPEKMSTQNVFQQSYVDFVLSKTGNDVTKDFSGGKMALHFGDSERFVVIFKEMNCNFYQVSLFSLCEMRFTSVVAQLDQPLVQSEIKDNIVAITNTEFHRFHDNSFSISLFTVNGQFITRVDLPPDNPLASDIFWFCGSHLIQKVDSCIRVTNLVDCIKVHEYAFEINKEQHILAFIYPKFLLLYKKLPDDHCLRQDFDGCREVSVWDIVSRTELWRLESLVYIRLCRNFLRNNEYPGKLLVVFEGDTKLSVLNFEKCTNDKKEP